MREMPLMLDISLVVVESAPGPLRPTFFEPLLPHLRDGRLEVLVVSSEPPEDLPDGARWIECATDDNVPRRRAAGLAEVEAPFVGITESFCVPGRDWVWGVLSTFSAVDVVAVGGPVGRRAGAPAAWALTLIEYGRFMGDTPVGRTYALPPINVCYRTETLRSAIGTSDAVFETDVDASLRARGAMSWRSPSVRMWDESDRPLGWAVKAQWRHGRLFGGRRAAGEATGRRMLRVALAPLVPLVLLARIGRGSLAAGHGERLALTLPALMLLLLSWTGGEVTGTLFGPGDTAAAWR